ncbi:unnamed protein product [Lampetra fluviatilis]
MSGWVGEWVGEWVGGPGNVTTGPSILSHENITLPGHVSVWVRAEGAGEDDPGCLVSPITDVAQLLRCGFNSSARSFLVIHGWSLMPLLDTWVWPLTQALLAQRPRCNVLVLDWLELASARYAEAVRRSRRVGKVIAAMVERVEEVTGHGAERWHLIGYSLGAHVAGFAGYHVGGGRVGRITGLDPAGPSFETSLSAGARLSRDDASYVDVVHTHTALGLAPNLGLGLGSNLGFSIGIRAALGHDDFYPNGGGAQPGCDFDNAVANVQRMGIVGLAESAKCGEGGELTGFLCSSPLSVRAFDEGRCVSCSGRRCQGLGHRSLRVRSARHAPQTPRTLYLRTSSTAPYKVYHYQVRVHLSGHWAAVGDSAGVTPSLRLSMHGSRGSALNLPLVLNGSLVENSTRWFLVDSPRDLGELHRVHLAWHRPPTWTDLWAQLYTLVPWESGSGKEGGQAGQAGPTYLHPQRLTVRKIRVKSAETQIRYAFCTPDYLHVELRPEREVTLRACPEGWVRKRDALRMRRLRKR